MRHERLLALENSLDRHEGDRGRHVRQKKMNLEKRVRGLQEKRKMLWGTEKIETEETEGPLEGKPVTLTQALAHSPSVTLTQTVV